MPFLNKFGQSNDCMCGLVFYLSDLNISSDEAIPVPLQNVSINAKLVDFVSEVTVVQSYVNVENNPIEVVYMFPIEEEAAVIYFEAEVDGRKILTQVKEKEQAREVYAEAMRNKKTAVLLEETQPDIFRIKLGQLKPGAGTKIVIKYICELPVEESKVRLTIPTTIAPRYVSPTDKSESAPLIASIPYSSEKPAGLTLNIEGLMQTKIKSVKSPSHEVKIVINEEVNSHGQHEFHGELSSKTTDMNKDIIILVEGENEDVLNKPVVFLETYEGDKKNIGAVGMVSLVPSFNLKEQSTELIFLVDRSGSMDGSSILQAKKALELFLHSMPSECYFNIWSFGSKFDALFGGGSKMYSDNSMKKAIEHVQSMDANYGGTEIYNPLKAIFDQKAPSKSHLRQIFILTDGAVSNAPVVISLVKEKKGQGRVFSLGLGSSASRHLVKGLARVGCGTAMFANEMEDLRPKVMAQLKNALQPAISNINISWDNEACSTGKKADSAVVLETKKTLLGYVKPKKREKIKHSKIEDNIEIFNMVGQVPTMIPPIFDGSRLLLYHIFDSNCKMPKKVNITAESPDGPLTIDLDIDTANILKGENLVRKLAARKKIQELEEHQILDQYGYEDTDQETSDKKKNTIIQLGIENSLASKHTSFVGVDEKTNNHTNDMAMMTREIKNQIPSGFGYRNDIQPMMSTRGSMKCMKSSMKSTDNARSARSMTSGVFTFQESSNDVFLCSMSNVVSRMSTPKSFDLSGIRRESCKISGDLECMEDCMEEEGECTDMFVGEGRSFSQKEQKKESNTLSDKMTALINLQKSNGMFEISDKLMKDDYSVFTLYTGNLERVKLSCPEGTSLSFWITALAMKILELNMSEKKDLWELVVLKSHKYLLSQLKNNTDEYNKLQDNAEKYILKYSELS